MVYWTKVKGQSALRAVPVPQEDRYMKKPSKWKVNALVLLLTAVCIALAVFGVIQLGNVLQKVDEQKALAESTPVPTAEPTPESTPTPEPVRDSRRRQRHRGQAGIKQRRKSCTFSKCRKEITQEKFYG